MWNSPHKESDDGKRYRIQDLGAFTLILDVMLDSTANMEVREHVGETILHSMTKEEFVYSLYEVFDALTGSDPVPEDGHPGYQEAIVAEMLSRALDEVIAELEDPEFGTDARRVVWECLAKLRPDRMEAFLAGLGIAPEIRDPYLGEEFNEDLWEEILLGYNGLWGEFLWDDDWRIQALQDAPDEDPEQADIETEAELGILHKLPRTPMKSELLMAEYFLKYVILKSEVCGN